MKRIFILSVIGLLLAGCGSNNIAQENLSNAVSMGWDEGVAALKLNDPVLENGAGKVWTDMRPLSASNVALVTYRVELEKDAFMLGEGAEPYLYGGGLLQLKGDGAVFTDLEQFSTEGEINMWGYHTSPDGEAALVDWLGEPRNLAGFGSFGTKGLIPAEALKLGDDGSIGEVVMASVATAGNGVETAVLTNNENITELADFTCQGRMIPNSNQASISYTAKTEDGSTLMGAGVTMFVFQHFPAAISDTPFECTMEGKGGIAYRAVVDGIEGAQIVDLEIEGLKVRTANGETASIDKATVYGFNIGMPPGSNSAWGTVLTDFNIGMPPN